MRRSVAPRKSSLAGRQVRAEARTNAHNLTLQKDRTINPLGFRMPDPGPMNGGKRSGKRWARKDEALTYLAKVERGEVPMGLRACAAQDYLEGGK